MSHRNARKGELKWGGFCQRCGKKSGNHIMSMFCRQLICLACSLEERRHPKFSEAMQADDDACRRGDLNFEGVGLPEDLM